LTHSSASGGTRSLVAPELIQALDKLPSFDFNAEVLRGLRAGTPLTSMTPPPLSPLQQTIVCEQRLVPGPPGAPKVRVLVYMPPTRADGPRPAYLHMHGGGFVLGVPEINDGSNRMLAAELDCVVVSVDYRLAPETRYPGAVEDCYAALSWLISQADELGVDRERIAIGGESAGGGHAATLALLVRKRGRFKLRLQLLDSPMLDDRTGTAPDPHPYCGEFVWTPASNRFGWRSLLGKEPGGVDVPVEAVPARATDLSGLTPTFILVGALDLFLEEDMEYARRLTRAGIPTELHIIPGAFHGFGAAGEDQPLVRACLNLRRDALARALAARGA
jgi:acetyl esterase/lipase